MANRVSPELLSDLIALATPLVERAVDAAKPLIYTHEGAVAEDIERAQRVQGVVLAFQGVLLTPRLASVDIGEVMIALASVCGTVLAQCGGDKSAVYRLFQTQFAATLAEVSEARREAMN